MDDPQPTSAEPAERDAESAELYAPPREDKALSPSERYPKAPANAALVGFLALLVTTAVSSAIAAGLMILWYNTTPIGTGFLSGLKETILAFFAWAALSSFAMLGGIVLAAGVLGRDGKASRLGWGFTVIFAVAAAVICFIPDPESTYVYRGLLGLLSEGISLALTMVVLNFARRRYIGPPPPPPWMAG